MPVAIGVVIAGHGEHAGRAGDGLLGGGDKQAEERAKEFVEGAPEVRHLLPAAGPALTDNR